MTSKSKVLHLLEQNRGCYLSGAQLAKTLEISRSAVWKAIKELEKEGYAISAATNRGYCLTAENDVLSAEGILACWKDGVREQLHVHKEIDSTNSEAKRLALSGAPHRTVVLAESQTGGRGRLGRSFYSPAGSGIYLSMLLRPQLSAEQSLLVTTATSVCVCHAIEQVTGRACAIKWVNDIYCRKRKVCGILTEATTNFETGAIDSIVVGIGINFKRRDEDFPADILGKAGALYQEDTEGVTRNQLVAALLAQLSNLDTMLSDGAFLSEYKARSLVLGKKVELLSRSGTESVQVLDINRQGGLVVRYEDGREGVVQTGEISIRGDFL